MARNIAEYDNFRDKTQPKQSNLLNNGDPAVANSFLLEVDGTEIGIFKEVRGLEFNVEVEAFTEGGQNQFQHRFIKRLNWANIVMRRGITEGDALFKWVERTSGANFAKNSNKVVLSTGAITAINYTGERLRAWNFIGAMPVKWTGPDFGVDKRDPLDEMIEIAHQGFTSKTY